MQKELKFQSELSCKRQNIEETIKSNEVTIIVLKEPQITEKKLNYCENICQNKCNNFVPSLVYYFLFSRLI